MVLKKRVIAVISTVVSVIALFFCATIVEAARADMVDVSNNNGSMTVANFQDMYNNYGVKAIVTKISEVLLLKIVLRQVISPMLKLLVFISMAIIMLDIIALAVR